MKRLALLIALAATPALAQQPAPPIAMPQDTLQRISVYLQDGGSHNEGYALNKSITDAIAVRRLEAGLSAAEAKATELAAAAAKAAETAAAAAKATAAP